MLKNIFVNLYYEPGLHSGIVEAEQSKRGIKLQVEDQRRCYGGFLRRSGKLYSAATMTDKTCFSPSSTFSDLPDRFIPKFLCKTYPCHEILRLVYLNCSPLAKL
jgi:hypothetical protein